ncbi:hypothetical protein [Leptospira noguchii]|uniref:hypothetical protein n=1 Tax=Leptospira noguchii TaxID=28182 RepID=UPI001FB7631F|nr:hypothetical protein [Leptospira noguchii]UOG32335.1 hypothetical protein MAL06_02640 [Leptospira noguchii]UOG54560.1 hypothetical protein MAL09_02730 [Leptospira noguchii]
MLRSIVSSIEFEKFRRNWSEKNSMKRFLRKRFRSRAHFSYEIRELRRRPVESRCIEFIIRPNFLRPNSRYLRFFTTDPFRGSSHTQDKLFKNFKM